MRVRMSIPDPTGQIPGHWDQGAKAMLLNEELRNQGNFLFRWRGYLPFFLLPLAVVAVQDSGYFFTVFGEAGEEAWEVLCLVISLSGLCIRAFVIGFAPRGTSGRNTDAQRAEVLNTTGPYSIARNPLYLGNYLVLLGFVLAIKVWWFILLACLIFAIYYERIILAEESFLQRKFGDVYLDWAARTPAFFPNFRLWRRSALSFSTRSALRREYNCFFLIVVFFTANEMAYDLLFEGERLGVWLAEEFTWIVFFGVGAAVFLCLRTLKRHTRFLNVSGR